MSHYFLDTQYTVCQGSNPIGIRLNKKKYAYFYILLAILFQQLQNFHATNMAENTGCDFRRE